MIRERRNKDKLASYYRKFMEEGIVDPNVHPWVADSWQRCRAMHLPHETMPKINKLSHEEIIAHQKTHEFIVKYVDGLYEQSKQHFNIHNLSMLLIDENGYVIKNYAMPFFQRIIEDIQGMRVLEEDVGTSSISIAREHNVPFYSNTFYRNSGNLHLQIQPGYTALHYNRLPMIRVHINASQHNRI